MSTDFHCQIENGVLKNYTGSAAEIVIPKRVKSIGYMAFSGSGLTSVTIPDNVTSISSGAFSCCTTLTSVSVVEENQFYCSIDGILYDKSATKIVCVPEGIQGSIRIPDSVTSVGGGAFSRCTGLTSVTIPDSVTSIENYAFSGCIGLTSVTIPNSVKSIGDSAFYGCTNLANISVVKKNLFYRSIDGILYNKRATKIVYVPKGIQGHIRIPDSVKSIGAAAFSNCYRLTSITIPDGVTGIGYSAFNGCSGLTSVTIPDSVTGIGNCAFRSCTGLTSVTIPDSVTGIEMQAFEGCTGLTSVTIPDSVTGIEMQAFEGCTGLTSVTIPDSVTSVEKFAFSKCTGLTSVTIPDSVKSIGVYAFDGCTGLTNVTFGNGLTSIEDSAFRGCTALTDIFFRGTKQEWFVIKKAHDYEDFGDDDYVPEMVTVYADWDRNTGRYTVHCTDGDIEK